MPIPVDHDQRRRDIADATWSVIEEAGVQGVTMRRVAEKMNGSTTLVTHYFKDRDSLISFANERTFDRWRAELEEVATGDPDEALLALLHWALPTSREGVRFARALISIIDYAYTNEVVAAALYSWSDWYWHKVRDVIDAWAKSGHDGPPIDVKAVVDTVRAMFNGINLSMLQGDAWTVVGEDSVELVLSVIEGLAGRKVVRPASTTGTASTTDEAGKPAAAVSGATA